MLKRLIWIVVICIVAIAGLLLVQHRQSGAGAGANEFDRLMSRGSALYEKGDATNAVAVFSEAVKQSPESVDARLNLANAYLLADENQKAIDQCQEALRFDHENAAAYYLMGLAHLHLNHAEQATQAFQESQKIDPAVTALNFQLGLAEEKLGHVEDAIIEFETILQFEPEHPSAHYQLSRLYLRANRPEDAAKEMAKHQQIQAKNSDRAPNPRAFEICKYTQPRVAFKLEQPDRAGIPVRFANATSDAFGVGAANYHAPLAVLDYNHDGRNSLVVSETNSFRVLDNLRGKFKPLNQLLLPKQGATFRQLLVGDMNNDGFEDVVAIGPQGVQAFRFATNAQALDVTAAAGLQEAKGQGGVLADLDFTGRLDLLLEGGGLYRNLGNFYFKENTNSGLPNVIEGRALVEDWNNDDVPGVFVTQPNGDRPPVFFAKQRAGKFVQTNSAANWPAGTVMASSDLNNDFRADVVVGRSNQISIVFGGERPVATLPAPDLNVRGILLIDYDNDGWLDILAYGKGLRVWRNLGDKGFAEVSKAIGLNKDEAITGAVTADFDQDGDTDLVLSASGGLEFWRNDGGNANRQLKLQLVGKRSNASGLGVRVDVTAGNWRTRRSLQQPPFEIGVGKHDKIEALKTRWFDLTTTAVDLPVENKPLQLVELTVPAGSCPYLYAWDGHKFRFVTDILGASPLGLPLAEGRLIEADPEEFLALGNEEAFPPKDGKYEIRITEELREVLYLDEARLVVVDHPEGTLVHSTSKLRPGKPFPPHELWTLKPIGPPTHATRSDGLDVTEALARTDQRMVSPVKIREPQLRGLAEPFSITMDFGGLPTERPLVLALNGWLRFGGGMANIAGSLDPNLPFPFPSLEAEVPDGSWKKIETDVGAPAGKTKTILIDLDRKLPAGARRLRLTTAFEIHWDSALLCEKSTAESNLQTSILPQSADLRWRGFSEFQNLPDFLPLTPDYDKTFPVPPWSRTPSGWCTRYGDVNELVAREDDRLVLLNGGDEVALSFRADQLPPKRPGDIRDFFLHVVGWDKDADFHVGQGWRVEPMPFRGMDDQQYGYSNSHPSATPEWMTKYNTRWVSPVLVTKREKAVPVPKGN